MQKDTYNFLGVSTFENHKQRLVSVKCGVSHNIIISCKLFDLKNNVVYIEDFNQALN